MSPTICWDVDPAAGYGVRHRLHETPVPRVVRDAAARAGPAERVTSQTFRHSVAAHLLAADYDIRRQYGSCPGHTDVRTTMRFPDSRTGVALEPGRRAARRDTGPARGRGVGAGRTLKQTCVCHGRRIVGPRRMSRRRNSLPVAFADTRRA